MKNYNAIYNREITVSKLSDFRLKLGLYEEYNKSNKVSINMEIYNIDNLR